MVLCISRIVRPQSCDATESQGETPTRNATPFPETLSECAVRERKKKTQRESETPSGSQTAIPRRETAQAGI